MRNSSFRFDDLDAALSMFGCSAGRILHFFQSGDIGAIEAQVDNLIERIDSYSQGDNEPLRKIAEGITSGTLGAATPLISFIGQEAAINWYSQEKHIRRILRGFKKSGQARSTGFAEKYGKLLFVSEVLLNPLIRYAFKSCQHTLRKLNDHIQNPFLPSSFCSLHNLEKTHSHTWHKAFLLLNSKNTPLHFNSPCLKQSLFKYAQFLELSSAVSKSNPLTVSKRNIQHNFERILAGTRTSDVIVFACTSYLEKYVDEYKKEIYKAYKVRECRIPSSLSSIPQLKGVCKSSSRIILLTHQLSGSCGWSNHDLGKIRKYLFNS